MKNIRYLISLLLILGMLSSCKEKEPQAPWEQERPQTEATEPTPDTESPSDIPAEAPQQREDIYTVTRIVDGDTFVAEKDGVSVRVRLMAWIPWSPFILIKRWNILPEGKALPEDNPAR